MDLISQVKMADVMMKFLRGDMIHLTPYPFTAGKPAFEPDGDPRLPRSTPEREGIPSGYLRDFFRQADGAGELPLLHSAAVLCHGKLVACVSRAPYSAALPHMTFSFSKTVVSMAVGMAAAEGLLSVEDSVVSFFPEKQPPLFRSPRMAAMKIRHLLTMTSGANFSEAGSEMERDWVRGFFYSDCAYMPGEKFHYNSMNSYLLAAILRKVTGQTLTEYLTPRLFEPLGIPPVYWETCPMGIEKGGWGLYLRVTDMAKLGELCLRGGMWEGKRILSEEWLKKMLSFEVETEHDGMTRYGYQLWSFPAPHSYQFNGVFGQYAVVLPELDMVIATTGGDASLFFNRVLDAIDDFFGSGAPARYAQWLEEHPSCRARRLCRDPMRDDPKSLRLLRDPWTDPEPVGWFSRLCALFSARRAGVLSPAPLLPDAALRFCTAVDSGENAVCSVGPGWYRLEKSFASLLPLILAGVTNNFSAPLSGLRFRAEGGCLFVDAAMGGDGAVSFPVGVNGRAERGTVVIHGEPYAIAARAKFRLDEEGRDVLFLDVFFLEAPSVRRLKIIRTGEDSILVRFLEYPSVEEAARMLLTLVGGDTGASGGVWDLFGQDVIRHRLYGRMKEICFPRAAGRLQARREELPESVPEQK